MAQTDEQSRPRWHGRFDFGANDAVFWNVGPLRLLIERASERWRCSWTQGDDPLETVWNVSRDLPEDPGFSGKHTLLAATSKGYDHILVTPRLADRPVVTRPLQPLTVLPSDAVTLYVSSVVWVHVVWPGVTEALLDVPTFRPSDTWFGPSRIEGELCYSSRTRALADVGDLPVLPGRALTRVEVQNKGDTRLRVERIKLPVDRLAMYINASGQLWTDGLVYEVTGAASDADVRRDQGPPTVAGDVEVVHQPRAHGNLTTWKRALSGLLG